MTTVSLIAVVDEHGGLGQNNQLLCHLPADLAHFKALTISKPIIMGRRTFESIGKPLPGRRNIVLSRQSQAISGVEVMSSLQEVLESTALSPEIMVIGGAQIYESVFSMASRIYLTRIEHAFHPDVFFPTIDPKVWHCIKKEYRATDEKNPYGLWFCKYERIKGDL